MKNRACELCEYYKPDKSLGGHLGECRKNPPTEKGFPDTKYKSWCGAFVEAEDDE